MPHAPSIAEKLAAALSRTGYPCTRERSILTIPKLGLRVQVLEGDEKQYQQAVSINTAIVTFHRVLPGGFARELVVGRGGTLQQAAADATGAWMLGFFPLLKIMFDERPHDCTVVEKEAPELGTDQYRLIAGPILMMGFGGEGEAMEGMSQSLLWERFSDVAAERVKHGVHHLRCFAGKFGDEVSADVFLDGREWPEGSSRLRELAMTFPRPDAAHPIYSLKQHLMLCPLDMHGSAQREQNATLSAWIGALSGKLEEKHQEWTMPVLRALYVMSPFSSEQESEEILVSQGVQRSTAERLVNFLQSAAVRVMIADKEIKFSETYYLTNWQSRRAALHRYDETPEFMAGLAILRRLWDAEMARTEISGIGMRSSEFNCLTQMANEGAKLGNAKFSAMFHSTSEPVEGLGVDEIMDAMKPKSVAKKPWWRFW